MQHYRSTTATDQHISKWNESRNRTKSEMCANLVIYIFSVNIFVCCCWESFFCSVFILFMCVCVCFCFSSSAFFVVYRPWTTARERERVSSALGLCFDDLWHLYTSTLSDIGLMFALCHICCTCFVFLSVVSFSFGWACVVAANRNNSTSYSLIFFLFLSLPSSSFRCCCCCCCTMQLCGGCECVCVFLFFLFSLWASMSVRISVRPNVKQA